MAIKYYNGMETDAAVLAAEGFVLSSGSVIPSVAQRHRTFSGFGGNKSLILPTNGSFVRIPAYTAGVSEEVGFALYRVAAGTKMTIDLDIALNTNCRIVIDSDNFVRIYRGSGTLLTTSADVLPVDTWTWFKLVINAREAADTGRVRVFVNGTTTAFADTGAGIDCRGASVDHFDSVLFTSGFGACHLDDYVQTASGDLGNKALFAQLGRPTADSGAQQGVPSTGVTNFGTVDEDPVSLIDFNQLNLATHKDMFVISDIVGTPGNVRAMRTIAMVTGEGSLTTLRGFVEHNGVKLYGTNQPTQVGGTYGVVTDIFEVDADGGGALSGTSVNAHLAGYEAN